MKPVRGVAFLAIVLSIAACATGASSAASSTDASSPSAARASAAAPGSLTVFAAASLRGPLEAAVQAYEQAVPASGIALSTDSSATLRTQIEQGAPADLFLSADTENPQVLADAGLVDGEPVIFAGNTLAIIVPVENPADIGTSADLATPGVKIVAAGNEVPITRYASKVVANLGHLAGHPADFAAAYQGNVVSREDNVKAVAAKIELGEGDAGIVYVTDAAASQGVATIRIPDEANVTASYGGVVVKASGRHAAARAFMDWLTGPDGQAILAAFGFLPPPP